MTFFKRSIQGIKENVGLSKKTADSEVNELKIELQTLIKKLKKTNSDFAKLPDQGRVSTVGHMTSFKDAMEIMNEESAINQCHSIFEEIDMKTHLYGMKIKEESIQPIGKLMEMANVMEKRMKTLEQRRLDKDSAEHKYQSILKKPIDKQKGLDEAVIRLNETKDNYDYLRNEIVNDVKLCIKEIKLQFPQICINIMKSYTDFVNELNEIWGKVPQLIGSVEEYDLKKEFPITSNENSMINIENVKSKKHEEMNAFIVSDGNEMKKEGNEVKQEKKPEIPEKPKKEEEKKEEVKVKALYDYVASDEGELSFKENDVITVLDSSSDWWKGELNGKIGLFPSNYVEKK